MKISVNKDKKLEIIYILIILMLVILAYTAGVKDGKEDITKEVSYKNYTVRQGEVLEDVAMRYYADVYLPKAKSDIKKLNNMEESDIYAGQVLKLEVK